MAGDMLPTLSAAPPPMQPTRRWMPQIQQAIEQLQRESALRQAAEAQGQQPPEQFDPLAGEVPGEGYLFARDPETRQATLVETTPEYARKMLLRAIELCAANALLPYGDQTPAELSKAALAFSQAYLLLDPSVDQNGVPIGASEHAAAEAQAKFQFPVTQDGHPEPPRVNPNPAEKAIAEEHRSQTEELRGARGDRPRPQPRVGG